MLINPITLHKTYMAKNKKSATPPEGGLAKGNRKRKTAGGLPSDPATVCGGACEIGPWTGDDRQDEAIRLREEAAHCSHQDERCSGTHCAHPCNGDEAHYYGTPNPFQGQYIASYTKGIPHNALTGLGDPTVYCLLLKALATGDPADFEAISPLGCGMSIAQRKLENPQSAFAYELEGSDPHDLYMPPAPAFASVQEAAEIAELYWMALTRDVPFTQYATHSLIADAVSDLNTNFFEDVSPHLPGLFNPQTIFRGPTKGDRLGPYLSQFLLLDVPYGAQLIPATIRTLLPSIDFMTNWDAWLAVQNGCDADQSNCDPVFRLIRSGRDLAQFVHVDRDFNAFLNACQLLLFGREPVRRCEARPGLGVPFGPCLPYVNVMAPPNEEFPQSPDPFAGKSQNQLGQGTFGDQHIKSLLVGSMYRAFHAVWYQKWAVHRRLRPEEFGGRVHLKRRFDLGDSVEPLHNFPVNAALFNSDLFTTNLLFNYNARQNANRRTPATDRLGEPSNGGTYLLPMVYAEGSPLHPSYGSGHSTVAGCLATILKAFFHNDWRFPSPVEANEEGTSLRPYMGPDADQLTVAGELDKLASNIGLGRDWAGVHWRSDHEEAMLMGEQLAISILCAERHMFNEPYEFRFRSFDFGPYNGQVVRIRPGSTSWNSPGDSCESCVDLLPEDQYDPVLSGAACDRRRRPNAPVA